MTDLKQARLEKARATAGDAYDIRGMGGAAQSVRDGKDDGCAAMIASLAILTELNWQPPVDPDEEIVREIWACAYDALNAPATAANTRNGAWPLDYAKHAPWAAALAAYKAAKVQP